MKYLLKQAFKSLFNSKIFAIIIMVVIFLTGGVYTLLVSTSDSFSQSYKNAVTNANLEDAIVKLNLKFDDSQDSIYIQPASTQPTTQPDGTKGLSDEITNINNFSPVVKTDADKGTTTYTFNAKITNATGRYQYLKDNLLTFGEDMSDSTSQKEDFQKDTIKYLNDQISLFRNEAKRQEEINYGKHLPDRFNNQFVSRTIQSISVVGDRQAYKVVRVPYDDKGINQMVVYDGTDQFMQELSKHELEEELKERIKVNTYRNSGKILTDLDIQKQYTINNTKGFRITAVAQGNVGAVQVTDPASLQAIVSTSWANHNGKQALSINQLREIFQDKENQNQKGEFEWSQKLLNEYWQNIVEVDKTPFFITGIGQQPDFAFPIIDVTRPLPKTTDEAVVFVSNAGYNRIVDGFRTNPTENYVAIKFNSDLDEKARVNLINQMNRELRSAHTNSNKQAVSNFNFPANNWPSNIKIVTPIEDSTNSSILAPERVNFLSDIKNSINTLNYLTTTFLIIFVASIITMVFFALISSKKKIFASLVAQGYNKHKVSASIAIVSLLLVAVPSIFGYLVGFGSQYTLIDILSRTWTIPTYGSTFSWLSLVIVIAIPTLLTFLLVFVVGETVLRGKVINLLNDYNNASNSFIAIVMKPFAFVGTKTKYMLTLVFKNSHRLVLVTVVSIISSIAIMVSLSSFRVADKAYHKTIEFTNWEYKVNLYTPTTEGGEYELVKGREALSSLPHGATYGSGNSVDLSKPHWHIPSTGDASAQNNIEYLRNKIQTKYLLDKKVGGVNPWDIASSLMPDNQLNKANENSKLIASDARINDAESFMRRVRTGDINPYLLTYKTLVIDNADETYTYLDSMLNGEKYKILGIRHYSHYVNLGKSLWNNLFNHENDKYKPLIINQYISRKLNLNKGDIVDADIFNNTNRKLQEAKKDVKSKFKILDIVDTYNDGGLFTTQKIANTILELNNNESFNGVFVKNKNTPLLNSIPLYSPSGMYPGKDTFSSSDEQVINTYLSNKQIFENMQYKRFIDTYGINPYVSAFKDFGWKDSDRYTFENISKLSSSILDFIEGISLSISIMFIVLVTILMINANKKKISTLWTLGYRKKEIARIFIGIYALPLLLTIIFATLISYFVVGHIVTFIMGFGHILIPIALFWWMPIVAIAIIFLIISISVFISINKLSNQNALLAFKGED